MKVLVVKNGHGDYEDYYEWVEKVYLMPDDSPLNDNLIMDERNKFLSVFNENFQEWRMNFIDKRKATFKRYKTENPHKISFTEFIAEKYNLVEIEFMEDYIGN